MAGLGVSWANSQSTGSATISNDGGAVNLVGEIVTSSGTPAGNSAIFGNSERGTGLHVMTGLLGLAYRKRLYGRAAGIRPLRKGA